MTLLPGALEVLTRDVARRIEAGARSGAEITKAHLDEPGTGKHWPWLPHRSSAPGEYPARQYGPLQDSVGHEQVGETTFYVGSIHNPPPEAAILEFSPTSMGGRPWLSKSLEDSETRHMMLRAAVTGGGD